jgi:hypothetical protein
MSMPPWWPALGLATWAALLAALRLRGPLDEYTLAQLLMTFGPLVTVPLGLSLTPTRPGPHTNDAASPGTAQVALDASPGTAHVPLDASPGTAHVPLDASPEARRLRWLFPPLALGAFGLAAVALLDPGPALRLGLSVPYLLFTALAALHALLRLIERRSLALSELAIDIAIGCLAVAGMWLLVANADLVLSGFGGLWAMLTAAHFHFAGFGALLYLGLLGRARAGAGRRSWPFDLLACGLLLALPMLAFGIAASRSAELIGVSLYVVLLPWLALLTMHAALRLRMPLAARGRLLLSAACLLLSTTLAGLYGYRGHVPWDISIHTMLYFHASVNALGFVGLGLWGWHARAR